MPSTPHRSHRHAAGKPEAPFPIYAKSRTSSDIMKHAAKAFKHLDEGPRGEPAPSSGSGSAAHFTISPPHGNPSSALVTPAAPKSRTRADGDSDGPSIVSQLLTLSQLKKDNNLTDREFALAKWQVLGLAHKLENGAETEQDVRMVNAVSGRSSSFKTNQQQQQSKREKPGASRKQSSSRSRSTPGRATTPAAAAAAASSRPKQKISRLQQQHNDAVRSSPKPLYAHHYSKVYVSVAHARLGQRVTAVRQNGPPSSGTVRFSGLTQFAAGTWIGIELDCATGRNNGSVNGVKYFKCKMNHGLFVRPDSVYAEEDVLEAGATALKWVASDNNSSAGRLSPTQQYHPALKQGREKHQPRKRTSSHRKSRSSSKRVIVDDFDDVEGDDYGGGTPSGRTELAIVDPRDDPADAVIKIAAAHRRMEDNLQRMQAQLSQAMSSVAQKVRTYDDGVSNGGSRGGGSGGSGGGGRNGSTGRFGRSRRRREPEIDDEISIVEKLQNFYRVVDPARVAVAPILIERFGDSAEKLAIMCESLQQRYGVAPSLLPED